MENTIVLDSNVFNKLFLKEDDRSQVINLIMELSDRNITILVPSLFLYEVLSVAAISNYSTELAYNLIGQYQKVNLKLTEIDDETISRAINITKEGRLNSGYPSFYDSAYHSLAIQNKNQFVTADKRHQAKAESFGHITLLKDWKKLFTSE